MPAPVRFSCEEDADLHALDGQQVCVVGYGNLGASMAKNLRDSGLAVIVGNIDDDYRQAARADGFEVRDIAEAAAGADLVYLLIADETIPACFAAEIEPSLRPGAAVVFASGYCLAFGLVTPPPHVDVLLIAPRMLGEEVRRCYVDGTGFFSFVSVEQDATGKAADRLLGVARAAGALRRGALHLDASKEALIDLLIEQTVGPYLGTAIQLAFELGTAAGLPAEALVLEMYMSGEMARTFQAFATNGFYRSVTGHGAVAEYGGFLRTLELDADAMRRHFRSVLDDIESGRFARRLQEEAAAGYPSVQAINAITEGNDPMSQAEDRVRRELAG